MARLYEFTYSRGNVKSKAIDNRLLLIPWPTAQGQGIPHEPGYNSPL